MLGLRTQSGRTRHLAHRRAPPQPAGHTALGTSFPVLSGFPRHCWGPGPRRGRWLGEGRTRLGPAQRYPALVSYLLLAPSITAIVPLGIPCITHPGAGSFFPPFFHPRSSAGARASAGLRAQTREAPAPAAATARAEPSVPGSGPHSRVLPGPEATRTLGTLTLAPLPRYASQEPQPDPALTCSRAAPAPARRAESPGSRMGAGGLMDRGRRRRVAVAGAARVLAGRNGSRSTSSRSCSPPSPPFPPPTPPPPPPGSPGRMPGRGKSVLLPVSLRGYARCGAALIEAAAAAAAPAASPPPSPRSRGGRGAGAGSGLRAPGSGSGRGLSLGSPKTGAADVHWVAGAGVRAAARSAVAGTAATAAAARGLARGPCSLLARSSPGTVCFSCEGGGLRRAARGGRSQSQTPE